MAWSGHDLPGHAAQFPFFTRSGELVCAEAFESLAQRGVLHPRFVPTGNDRRLRLCNSNFAIEGSLQSGIAAAMI